MNSDFQILERRAPVLGIQRNVGSDEVNDRAWLTAHNVVVRSGELVKASGWTKHARSPLRGAVNFIQPLRYRSGASATVVMTNLFGFRINGDKPPVPLNDKPFAMAANDAWDADYLNKIWNFTNKSDGWLTWNGVDKLAAVDYAKDIRGATVAQFASHLLFGNLAGNDTSSGYTIATTDLLTRGLNFDFEDQASDAEEFELFDDASVVQKLLRGPQSLLFGYKKRSIHYFSYGGDFGYQRVCAVPNEGLQARRAIFDLGTEHAYMGLKNLYRFNGSSNLAFGDPVWLWWMEQIARKARPYVHSFNDERFGEAAFGFRSIVSPTGTFDQALVWNYDYNVFTTRDWPFSAVGYVQSAASLADDLPFDDLSHPMDDSEDPVDTEDDLQDYDLLAGDNQGRLFVVDEAVSKADDKELELTLESGDTLHDSDHEKICNGLWLDVSDLTGTPLKVYICARENLKAPIVWSGPYNFAAADSTFVEASDFPTGIWFRYKFVKSDGTFSLRGYGPSIQVRGRY